MQTVTVLLLLFQFKFLVFIFLLYLPGLGLSKLCWIKVVRVGILVLFLILEKMLSDFHCWQLCSLWICYMYVCVCGFYYVEVGLFFIYYVEVDSLYAPFWSFCHRWGLNFAESFFCISWDDHMVFILQFATRVYHIDSFM